MELLISIFIFSLISIAIIAVFVSSVMSYQKSRSIKFLKENIEYSLNSIAKDVRMSSIVSSGNGSRSLTLELRRNRGGAICYEIDSGSLSYDDSPGDCTGTMKKMIDLSGAEMAIDTSTSGFYFCPSAVSSGDFCQVAGENGRGWVEINFNVNMDAGAEMRSDQISVQTIVSSRDYGWENRLTP